MTTDPPNTGRGGRLRERQCRRGDECPVRSGDDVSRRRLDRRRRRSTTSNVHEPRTVEGDRTTEIFKEFLEVKYDEMEDVNPDGE